MPFGLTVADQVGSETIVLTETTAEVVQRRLVPRQPPSAYHFYPGRPSTCKPALTTVARGGRTVHRISAVVNVGGSLVELHLDSEQDHELTALVDELNAKLRSLALQAVQAAFKPEER